MELLSPAGSWEQVFSAIESGCNALYGGLQNWNARRRARNFTLKEYKEVLQYCHKYQVKFYLTLNSLMKTDEINEILKLFNNFEFPLPDAVIASDIGLITELRRNFPELPLHASTQFGTCSVSDLAFLEELGVQRAILARELSIKEIETLVKATNLELEVFVYGMQCIAFSGQCLMGGLLRGGSGNRGLCSSPCFDYYDVNSNKGDFFKLKFLNVGSYIKELEALGVDSIKIEGRLRSAKEIADITRYYRNIIDMGYTQDSDSNTGFLIDNSVANFSYHTIHENKISNFDIQMFKSLRKRDGSYIYYVTDTKKESFIKIHCIYDNQRLESFLVENRYGKVTQYCISPTGSQIEIPFGKVLSMIESYMGKQIYNVYSKVSVDDNISVNEERVEAVIKEISKEKDLKKCMNKHLAHKLKFGKNVWYETSNINLVKKLIEKGMNQIIFDITDKDSLNVALKLDQDCERITYKLPILDFAGKLNEIIQMLLGRKLMLSKISQIYLLNREDFPSISLEYTGNIWNEFAFDFIRKFGFSFITAHPELSVQYNKLMNQGTLNSYIQFIQFGKISLGYSRTCYKKYNLCDKICLNNKMYFRNIFEGNDVNYICNNRFGYRTIVSEDCFQVVNIDDNCSSRIILDNLPQKWTDSIINGIENIDCMVLDLYKTSVI